MLGVTVASSNVKTNNEISVASCPFSRKLHFTCRVLKKIAQSAVMYNAKILELSKTNF